MDEQSDAIAPTDESVQSGKYQPLSRPEFIYVNTLSAKEPVVKEYIKFYLENAGTLAREVGYVALPEAVYRLSYERFLERKTCSVFEKKSVVGANLFELLKNEA